MSISELRGKVTVEIIEAERQKKNFCVIETEGIFYAELQEDLWNQGKNVIFTGKPGKYVIVW